MVAAEVKEGHRGYLMRRRFGSLDGLRFLCIAAVLWHHAPVWTSDPSASQLSSRGFLGVDFFFVLSGFLITTLLLREQGRTGRISLRGFYVRRARRILPPYLLVVTVVAAYHIVWRGRAEYWDLLPFYYLFLANFLTEHIPLLTPMWSLSVEEQYYLLWPLLLLMLPRRWLLPVLAILVAVNVAAIQGAFATFGVQGVQIAHLRFSLPPATYAPILLGSAGAILLHHPQCFAVAERVLGRRLAAPLSFLAVLTLAGWGPENLLGWPNLLIHLAMVLSLMSIVVREDNGLAFILTWAPVARVGQISYGIYLYHLVALHVANIMLAFFNQHNLWSVLLVYSALSVLMAELSYRVLERPFLAVPSSSTGQPLTKDASPRPAGG